VCRRCVRVCFGARLVPAGDGIVVRVAELIEEMEERSRQLENL
jgi:hypothetical protein